MNITDIKTTIIKLANIVLSYRFFVFLTSFSFSIYFLLTFGALIQSYISQFGLYSCEYCFTNVDDFSHIMSSKIDIPFLTVSAFIFLSSIIFNIRLRIYITTLISSAFFLTLFDYIMAGEENKTASYIIENLMFNGFGAIFLSAFIIFNLASIHYTVNKKNINPALGSLIPLSSSLVISFIMYGFLYLVYERSPTHIDAIFSDKIIGSIEAPEKEFGFLTSLENTPEEVTINSLVDNKFKWDSGGGNYDMQVYLYSGCIINDDKFEKQKNSPTVIYNNVSSISFDTPHPVIYFAKGDNLQTQIKKSSSIFNNKTNEITSNISEGAAIFESMLHPLILFINISPIQEDGLAKQISYNISINGEMKSIKNIIPPIHIDDRHKKMKCTLIKSKNNQMNQFNTTYGVTSLALKFIPKGEINFKNKSRLEINILNGSLINKKEKENPLYGFNNGKVKHINLIGLEGLKISGRPIDVSSSDTIYATGYNLTGYITNDNKIKVFGLAEELAINNKIMNLKPISMLNNKLSYLNTSIFDILKIVFSMGVTIYILRYTLIFFRRSGKINILKK